MAYVSLALRIALGGLLLVAGVLKAHDGPAATAASVAAYRLLPAGAVAALGAFLPYFEIALGAYLVLGLFSRPVALVAAVQFLIFAAAVGSLVVRGIPADCGCFGSSVSTPPSWAHVALDLALACAAAVLARFGPGAAAIDRLLGTGGPYREQREAPGR